MTKFTAEASDANANLFPGVANDLSAQVDDEAFGPVEVPAPKKRVAKKKADADG